MSVLHHIKGETVLESRMFELSTHFQTLSVCLDQLVDGERKVVQEMNVVDPPGREHASPRMFYCQPLSVSPCLNAGQGGMCRLDAGPERPREDGY